MRSCWTSLLARTRSFRITAVRATFGGFPFPTSASYLALEVGIVLDRDLNTHQSSRKHLSRYVAEFAGRFNDRPRDTLDQMAEQGNHDDRQT